MEVANVLWKHAFILKRIPVNAYAELGSRLKPLIEASTSNIYSSFTVLDEALDVAARYNITIYDALFVALALKLKVKLASFDSTLKTKLEAAGLDIIFTP